jgi:DNA-binding transcriptional regulator YdaS (Cro superfamily)
VTNPIKQPFKPIEIACEAAKLLSDPSGLQRNRLKKGESALAQLLGVTPGTVNHWLWGRRPVPVAHCVRLEQLTAGAVTRQMLRPDDWASIWPDLIQPD